MEARDLNSATLTDKQVEMDRVVGIGAGITAGLEILWDATLSAYVLRDVSTDGRFAADVSTWNAAVSLNTSARKRIKNAKK